MDIKLVMFKTNGQRKDFPLSNPVTIIGRGENCDLQVPLLSVSRRHCEVNLSGSTLKAKDLASSNGTYVNNKRINETELSAGDRLAVGPIVFTIQVNGEPEEIRPVKTKGQKMAEAAGEQEEVAEVEVIEGGGEETPEVEPAEALAAAAAESPATERLEEVAALEPAGAEEDSDPISALEALAAESAKRDKGKKK